MIFCKHLSARNSIFHLLLITGALFVFCINTIQAQYESTDSEGNFYVAKNKLIWKRYYLLNDINKLDEQLKTNDLTNNLDILHHQTSAISNLVAINGENLPQYARQEFKAFVVVDIIDDKFRVTIKDITFPDFVQVRYYNGIKSNSGGTLDYYILTNKNTIKRNSSTNNVLYSFDTSFMDIFSSFSASVE